MFCPHTPGGELAAELRKAEEDTADGRLWRVKIVETAGVTVASKYARYPWAGPCPRLDCFCCTSNNQRYAEKIDEIFIFSQGPKSYLVGIIGDILVSKVELLV